MMDEQLLLQSLLWRTERLFGDKKIITRLETGTYHEYTYREFGQRVRKLASALEKAGVKRGDRIGTLAWNHYRHFELYYGIPAVEAICHTINMRLFPEQQRYIVNHAEDSMLFLDVDQIPNVEKMIAEGGIDTVKQFVLLCDKDEIPETSLSPVTSYEEFVATGDDDFEFRDFSERTAAAMCYTSATNGDPKGASVRSTPCGSAGQRRRARSCSSSRTPTARGCCRATATPSRRRRSASTTSRPR